MLRKARRRRAVPRRNRRAGPRRAGDAAARDRGAHFLPGRFGPRGAQRLPADRRHQPRPAAAVARGEFREDLLARINLWTFHLPGLRERPEDIEPNLEYELEQCSRALNLQIGFSHEARTRFLEFATSATARWSGNFRDLHAAIRRMATLCKGGRISVEEVGQEIERLNLAWRHPRSLPGGAQMPTACSRSSPPPRQRACDRARCVRSRAARRGAERSALDAPTLSEAGRRLFGVSRSRKKVPNDADRLRKYLARFALEWSDLHPQ